MVWMVMVKVNYRRNNRGAYNWNQDFFPDSKCFCCVNITRAARVKLLCILHPGNPSQPPPVRFELGTNSTRLRLKTAAAEHNPGSIYNFRKLYLAKHTHTVARTHTHTVGTRKSGSALSVDNALRLLDTPEKM